MTYPHDQEDEDRVFDALIVMALWNYPIGEGCRWTWPRPGWTDQSRS